MRNERCTSLTTLQSMGRTTSRRTTALGSVIGAARGTRPVSLAPAWSSSLVELVSSECGGEGHPL